jgi:hypothetical protein
VSVIVKQALVMAGGGLAIVLIALRLARRRLVSTRFAVSWIGLGCMVAGAAAFMPFVGRIGRLADMTPTAVLLAVSSVTLLAISVQLSISVSRLQEDLRTVAESHALLRRHVDDLERRA